MQNKLVSLYDMVKLADDAELSQPYIRYICGLNKDNQYRHQEILDIKVLLENICVSNIKLEGFIYNYIVPQLNKEFDLIKISHSSCLNIELKSNNVSFEKIRRQLIQNLHYLKLLNKEKLKTFLFISSSKSLFTLDSNNELIESTLEELVHEVNSFQEYEMLDLDSFFTPNNILVSPLNSTERFLLQDYMLTEHQENIKTEVVNYANKNTQGIFAAITGGPGTGKTLLVYDIARELAKKKRILIVHSGILCNGHRELNKHLSNIRIISAKELRLREIKDVDIVIVDEAHRLYTESLEKTMRWVKKAKALCLFSYDGDQTLSSSEKRRQTAETIEMLCEKSIFKLTNKIRTNKELSLFITCLRDLTKFRNEYSFPNVSIIFEPDKNNAVKRAKELSAYGYTYISFTPSSYNHELDYQIGCHNTHNVIGQEFEGVCMILDHHWHYVNGRLASTIHPNPDYLFPKLLYQGLTRVRNKLAIIVCNDILLRNILPLVKNS